MLPVRAASVHSRHLIDVAVFSAVINLLLLVVPLYLLQVYDRVLPSSSIDTLLYMSVMALAAMALLGVLEAVRARYANRLMARFDAETGAAVFFTAMEGPRAGYGDVQPLRDLQTLRSFVSSRAMFFLFDLPFAPLFILLLYFVHPWLFWLTLCGSLLLMAIALINQAVSRRSGGEAMENLARSMNYAQSFARNFETVRALGMKSHIVEQWGNRFVEGLQAFDRVTRINTLCSGLSRALRMSLQLGILGLGAYLVLNHEMTAGMIFASSIISGRAMQPMDQIVGAWPQIVDAGRALRRIDAARSAGHTVEPEIPLPPPEGEVRLEQVIYSVPGAPPAAPPLIKRLSLRIAPGESVAVIGPSQAGKSTLARLIVGAIEPRAGVVRLDGADIRHRSVDDLGRHIGYLPQDVELFPGTIAENIGRFDPQASGENIAEAAARAQVHRMVLSKHDGYDTVIGPMGMRLSGGERQRIGLAGAFYGNPKLMVLDEPNANLDREGEQALELALLEAHERGTTVIIITHRPSIAHRCNRVLMLRDGMIELFGPADDVLRRLAQNAADGQQRSPQDKVRPLMPRTESAQDAM